MRLQKPDNNDALHVIVWDPQRGKWLRVRDIQFRLFALKVSRLEYDIENGIDRCDGVGDALERLPIDRARTALVNLHNILVNAMRQWEKLYTGIDNVDSNS